MEPGEFGMELDYIERVVSYFRYRRELIETSTEADLVRSARVVLEHVMFDFKALDKRAKEDYPVPLNVFDGRD